jgi:hypothetical protein
LAEGLRRGQSCHGRNSAYVEAFRDAMRKLAYVEGNNVRFEYRFADGELDRLL